MSADELGEKLNKAAEASDMLTAATKELEKASVTDISAVLTSLDESDCRRLEAALASLNEAPKVEAPSKSQDPKDAVRARRAERILAKEEESKRALLKHLAESKQREALHAQERTQRIDAARAARREAQAAAKLAAAERARQNSLLAQRREERTAAKERERREKELARISAIKQSSS
eukprot:TRINITY_DN63746_c0_g1_i1.p1 TRINITY_DN63746_c0_g1~~TRINITY_DN63746_c0_g1_i1.p1  ORF type:complete len:177 (-),score=63.65 TRINITY_DN63746_c0_g1_i1:73-603(-)